MTEQNATPPPPPVPPAGPPTPPAEPAPVKQPRTLGIPLIVGIAVATFVLGGLLGTLVGGVVGYAIGDGHHDDGPDFGRGRIEQGDGGQFQRPGNLQQLPAPPNQTSPPSTGGSGSSGG